LKNLPSYTEFFEFFGHGRHESCAENYRKFIAPNIDSDTRQFWESNGFFGGIFYGSRINFFQKGGLYEHSRNGYFLRFFHKFARLLGCKPDEVIKAKTPAEQEALYQKYVSPFFDSFLIQTIGKMPVTLFGLGIPPQQYDELKRDLAEGGSVIDIYRERAHRLAVEYPIYENYFAWQAFARKYDTEKRQAVPEYLKEENYASLKANAERLHTDIISVTEKIRQQPPGSFNRFVFLDAQDWMNSEVMTDLWQTIADRAQPGSRVIFRTAGARSPIETNLPESLRARFHYEEALSRELFKKDRASIYGGFHLYVLKEK
jgi:S-adenosylmethionine-diacylglycerol 3-amino-3-carboxypropyl transferase